MNSQAETCDVDVIDLDGTLCRCNTFHEWARFTLLRPNSAVGIWYGFTLPMVCVIVGARATGLISHSTLKRWLILIWCIFAEQRRPARANRLIDEFVVMTFQAHANQGVVSRLRTSQAKHRLLATAAPELYAKRFADLINADCIASQNPKCCGWMRWEFSELIGDAKATKILETMGARRFRIFTDHHDDIPAILIAMEVVLVAPTERLVHFMNSMQIDFETID
jgi:hypothetical protein